MTHKDALRKLPDGTLTRDEVNAMIDMIEAWDTDYPWEPSRDEFSAPGDYDCYACGARVHFDYDMSDSKWYEQQPDAEAGHSDSCPWIKTREWERGA